MKNIAFASDFDSTLYFGKEKTPFHEEDLKAIKAFRKRGGLFGTCSGRARRGISYPSEGILTYDFKIITTGSYIVDKDDKVLYSSPIPKPMAKEIYFYLKKHYPEWIVINSGEKLLSTHAILDGRPPIKEDDLFVSEVYGISLDCLSEEEAYKAKKELETLYPRITAYQNKSFLDRVRKENSKGNGLRKLKEFLHLDVVAGRGDSYNDIPLLEEASPSYTFVSSPKEVQEEADVVVSSLADALNDLRDRFF